MKTLANFSTSITQIGMFIGLWLLLDRAAHALHCPVPASVLGLFVMVGLLVMRLLSQQQIEAGARHLLADLPLFFIPPLLSITESGVVFARYGVSLLATLIIGSVVVMSCTALIVDRVFRFEARLRAAGDAQ